MTKRWFALLTLVLASLLSIPAAAQAPRAAPPNDAFDDAEALVIGKDYKVKDIGAASGEVGLPPSGCEPVYDTVWYHFTAEREMIAYFSTAGSFFESPLYDSVDTVLVLYASPSPGSLTFHACDNGVFGGVAELNATLSEGVHYYLLAGINNENDWDSSSTLRVKSRALDVELTPENNGFEPPDNAEGWNTVGGAVVCGDTTYPAFAGACAFQFTGGTGKTTLSQKVSAPFVPRKAGHFLAGVVYRVFNEPIAKTKVKYSLTYTDGTPATVVTVSLNGAAPEIFYTSVPALLRPASKNISGVTIKVDFKSSTGVLLVDHAFLDYGAGILARGQTLPLPAAPAK